MDNNLQNTKIMDTINNSAISPAITTTIDVATSQDVETASVNTSKVIRDSTAKMLSEIKPRLNGIDATLNTELNNIGSKMNVIDAHLKVQDNDYDVLMKQVKELRDDVRTSFRLQVKFMMYSLVGVFGAIAIAAFTVIQLLEG